MSAKKLVLLNILVLLILVGGGVAAYSYYYQAENYIKTDNAQISGQQITIAAAANGKLVDWKGNEGNKFSKNDQVGNILTTGPDGKQVKIPVNIPTNGTIVQNSGVANSFVAAGTPLAIAYDLDHLWVTANIDETIVDKVEVGQDVDIYVDAFPNTTLNGKVERKGLASASTFSLLPSSNNTANYTKVTQVIPVTISIDDNRGVDLVPGMNVTVRIHK